MRIISTITVIIVSLGILWYIADTSIATRAVPTFDEFIGKGVEDEIASSTEATTTQRVSSTSGFPQDELERIDIKLSETTIHAMVARHPSTRERGLSGLPALAPDEGMLFIFPEQGRHSFWMKDMKFAIDIIWIASNRDIIAISSGISPDTYPDTFIPPRDVQFVLELGAGSAEKIGLKAGDKVVF